MGTFSVPARLANHERPEQSLTIDLLVDTGAIWTMLPGEIVSRLGLRTPRQRMVTLASGERISYPAGPVAIQLNGEEVITIFLAGPPGCLTLLGAVTLEEFGLAPDPVRKTLVPVGGPLA
ncbi:MAG: Retroviral aspartyl protease [Candidatus Rokubacteria bacterium]|nr:Retroviral aspartyl protease [Candidatus Rokubacteria bacterium]